MVDYARRMRARSVLVGEVTEVPENFRRTADPLGLARASDTISVPSLWGGGILGHGLAARLPLRRCASALERPCSWRKVPDYLKLFVRSDVNPTRGRWKAHVHSTPGSSGGEGSGSAAISPTVGPTTSAR